jgi:branched-chain amino acid transport system ATP-binding protein
VIPGISLEVNAGELVAIVAQTGRENHDHRTIAGLMHPTQGSIHFKGQDISRTPPTTHPPGHEFCA